MQSARATCQVCCGPFQQCLRHWYRQDGGFLLKFSSETAMLRQSSLKLNHSDLAVIVTAHGNIFLHSVDGVARSECCTQYRCKSAVSLARLAARRTFLLISYVLRYYICVTISCQTILHHTTVIIYHDIVILQAISYYTSDLAPLDGKSSSFPWTRSFLQA